MKHQFLIHSLFIVLSITGNLLCNTTIHDIKQETYTHIECTVHPITEKLARDSHIHIPGPKISSRMRSGTVVESSTNWSGYVAVSNINNPAKNSVSAVTGSWVVPSIIASRNNSYSAFWIGIDGYTSPTVEQLGTAHDWSSGALESYAWFEMYPGGSYSIGGFPLRAGDIISATIVYSGNGIFTMHLYNDTEQKYVSIPTQYTTLRTALRSSAEWIVEAPYYNGILPLANFGVGHLNNCTATINGVTNGIGLFPNIALTMVTPKGGLKAVTSPLLPDKKSFFVTWKGQ
ncbi:MAG TPA: G1 family glutamic endopeptidase [Candidatus Babeliales bacterium]|nr:G1 family glutamic endopeptidase [Candidatus Babeliales bacterium]